VEAVETGAVIIREAETMTNIGQMEITGIIREIRIIGTTIKHTKL